MEIKSFGRTNEFDKDLIDEKYKDQFGRTLKEQFIDYMETKSMSYELTDYLLDKGDTNKVTLMRGDSLYESVIKEGNTFRLWNGFASFTYDEEIAEKFSNAENVPDWYLDDSEWYANAEFPFKKYIDARESLVPVIIIIEPNHIPKCICTDNIIEKFNESEYLVYTEDIEFKIDRIDDNKLYCSVHEIPNMNLWRRN